MQRLAKSRHALAWRRPGCQANRALTIAGTGATMRPDAEREKIMNFTDEQTRRIADSLLTALLERGGMVLKAERGKVQGRIEEILRSNMGEEIDLDREARELLEKHLQTAPPGIDRQRLFLMIKKKLAEEKGIPL